MFFVTVITTVIRAGSGSKHIDMVASGKDQPLSFGPLRSRYLGFCCTSGRGR